MFWQEQTTPREGPSNREKKEQTPAKKTIIRSSQLNNVYR
jgi:hypothetical protein